jgi:hypothetical protein
VSRVPNLLCVACLLAVGGVVHEDVANAAETLLAPAYDTVTASSMRNLGMALVSYSMMEGDLDDVTVVGLADWGWEPTDTTEVTILVDGDEFRAVAHDVRPGASTFRISSTGDEANVSVQRVDAPLVPMDADLAPGVRIVRAEL